MPRAHFNKSMFFVMKSRRTYIKEKLLKIQNWRCCWCGHTLALEFATIEHIIPKFNGGISHPDNYAVAHLECNKLRGHNLDIEPHPHFLFDFIRKRIADYKTLISLENI